MRQRDMICRKESVHLFEFVICDSNESLSAHQDLFHFDPDAYLLCDTIPFKCLDIIDNTYHKIHIAASWENMLCIALWRTPVVIDDVIYILRDLGMTETDLQPFQDSGIEDIFPVLYYGKNFDILRKVCNLARKTAEYRLKDRNVRVDCHLVSSDPNKIIASSL